MDYKQQNQQEFSNFQDELGVKFENAEVSRQSFSSLQELDESELAKIEAGFESILPIN